MPRFMRWARCLAVPMIFVAPSCADDLTDTDTTRSLSIISGGGQTNTVGTTVASPVVMVGNSSGDGVQGATVTFTVASGGGTVTGETQTTDARGYARLGSWTFGHAPGPNVLHVTVDGSTAILAINATATVGPIATFEKTAGDNQSATVGTAVATKPAVRLADRFGNPISRVPIDFTVTGGGGQVTGEVQETNAEGVATIGSWTLGPTSGVNRLSAAIELWEYGGLPTPIEFTANGGEIQPSPHSGRQRHH